ncbi:MAG: T9SS type A sorting domain-containing protein [Candidatus Krumholzibacteria bacterium]|nr:T9SS type A sorting domain-containing protein [Candidatus Krumholzibacteria bacterium]MDH4338632.1 T9SS type A sorting domain-containing protein [Candidatus Krumholzibacteria bacterium]MDH5271314.1 T9SS type A sorting domain-containing protein [Candidatus Krumholzibacteria bacterium]MDH5627075.1 T9SS type A sorting domain-containing protein [Candidatus Krumholzibacteria bacterium]
MRFPRIACLLAVVCVSLTAGTTARAELPPVFITAWGDSGTANGQFNVPLGITTNAAGDVYVADYQNFRIQKFDNDGLFIAAWGDSGSAAGQFSFATRVATDLSGFVYVADYGNSRVQKFNSSGSFVLQLGSPGFGDGEFLGAPSVDIHLTTAFVADGGNRIQRFDNAGNFELAWGSPGTGPGQFSLPWDMAVSPSGKVYVADFGNHRVQRFDLDGNYETEWGAVGIYGIETDMDGNVYIAQNDTQAVVVPQIVKYDASGTVLAQWGSLGAGNGQFGYVGDVAVDGNGNVFVTDPVHHRIQKFGDVPTTDLTVVVSAPPRSVLCSAQINVSATVSNLGNLTAGPFTVTLRVSPDNVIDAADSLLASAAFDSLPAFTDSTVVLGNNYNGLTGNVYLGVTVDEEDAVLESDETNNQIVTPFQYAVPRINTVIDVPGDQGGLVHLSWFRSYFDAVLTGGEITEYTLWRAIDTTPPAGHWADVAAGATIPGEIGSVMRLSAATPPYFWELVDTQQAYFLPNYAKTLPTLFNVTEADSGYHYFLVIAHTGDPFTFYVSCVDSARSIDNLAPAQPQNLVASQSAAGELTLSWNANTEPDLSHYAVYRGGAPEFVPTSANRIGAPASPELVDAGWTWDSDYHYKVTALDVHGNESVVAVLGPGGTTSVLDRVPSRTYLGANQPNPFNPVTRIRFGLERASFVELTIFDATGRVVRRLVSGQRGAANHVVTWNGANDQGQPVASGMYFYRLKTGRFSQTRKMVLLK